MLTASTVVTMNPQSNTFVSSRMIYSSVFLPAPAAGVFHTELAHWQVRAVFNDLCPLPTC